MFNIGPMEIGVILFVLAVLIGAIALGVNVGIRLARRKR